MYHIIAKLPKDGECGWTDILVDGKITMTAFGTVTVCIGLLQKDRWEIDVRMENNLCVLLFYADAIIRND